MPKLYIKLTIPLYGKISGESLYKPKYLLDLYGITH